LTLRWAKALKGKGSPEPMAALIERALRDLVENKVTKEEIMASKLPVAPPAEEAPSVISVADQGTDKELKLALPPDDEEDEKKKSKKKKKKDEE